MKKLLFNKERRGVPIGQNICHNLDMGFDKSDRIISNHSALMDGVREYGEQLPVQIRRSRPHGRLVIRATINGGTGAADVDLIDLLLWLKKRWPEAIGDLEVIERLFGDADLSRFKVLADFTQPTND